MSFLRFITSYLYNEYQLYFPKSNDGRFILIECVQDDCFKNKSQNYLYHHLIKIHPDVYRWYVNSILKYGIMLLYLWSVRLWAPLILFLYAFHITYILTFSKLLLYNM